MTTFLPFQAVFVGSKIFSFLEIPTHLSIYSQTFAFVGSSMFFEKPLRSPPRRDTFLCQTKTLGSVRYLQYSDVRTPTISLQERDFSEQLARFAHMSSRSTVCCSTRAQKHISDEDDEQPLPQRQKTSVSMFNNEQKKKKRIILQRGGVERLCKEREREETNTPTQEHYQEKKDFSRA